MSFTVYVHFVGKCLFVNYDDALHVLMPDGTTPHMRHGASRSRGAKGASAAKVDRTATKHAVGHDAPPTSTDPRRYHLPRAVFNPVFADGKDYIVDLARGDNWFVNWRGKKTPGAAVDLVQELADVTLLSGGYKVRQDVLKNGVKDGRPSNLIAHVILPGTAIMRHERSNYATATPPGGPTIEQWMASAIEVRFEAETVLPLGDCTLSLPGGGAAVELTIANMPAPDYFPTAPDDPPTTLQDEHFEMFYDLLKGVATNAGTPKPGGGQMNVSGKAPYFCFSAKATG